MKKLLIGLFALGFLFVGSQAMAEDASITVTSPNTGFEVIELGQKVEIRWTTSPMEGVMLDVYVSDDKNKGPVVQTTNTGSLIYTLEKNLVPGSNYRAHVSLVSSNQTVTDSSDKPFTITAISSGDILPPVTASGCINNANFSVTTGQACPKVLVENDGCLAGYKFSPLSGKVCKEGIKVNSDLSPSGNSNSLVSNQIKRTLKLGVKGEDVKILQSFLGLSADGAFGPQTKAKVMEWQKTNGLTPDGAFGNRSLQKASFTTVPVVTACAPSSTPSIKLLSPNGGEKFTAGDKITVKWESCNGSSDPQVMIILRSTDLSVSKEIAVVPDTGNAIITLPASLAGGSAMWVTGGNYKIFVQLGGNAMNYTAPTDSSDNAFTIY